MPVGTELAEIAEEGAAASDGEAPRPPVGGPAPATEEASPGHRRAPSPPPRRPRRLRRLQRRPQRHPRRRLLPRARRRSLRARLRRCPRWSRPRRKARRRPRRAQPRRRPHPPHRIGRHARPRSAVADPVPAGAQAGRGARPRPVADRGNRHRRAHHEAGRDGGDRLRRRAAASPREPRRPPRPPRPRYRHPPPHKRRRHPRRRSPPSSPLAGARRRGRAPHAHPQGHRDSTWSPRSRPPPVPGRWSRSTSTTW